MKKCYRKSAFCYRKGIYGKYRVEIYSILRRYGSVYRVEKILIYGGSAYEKHKEKT